MKSLLKIVAAGAVALLATPLFAQNAKPTIMIVPNKMWCVSKGYYTESNRNGKVRQSEDYDRALIDPDFHNVRVAIAGIMADRGFPVVDAASQTESDDEDEMFDEAYEGAETGSETQTNAFDELLKRAKPDILLKVGWTLNEGGSTYSCEYTIEAIDSYSNKSVAPVDGSTGPQRRVIPLSAALKQTAKNNMDDFCDKLQNYFDDILENGREIRLDVRFANNGSGLNMNSEFGGKELSEIIFNWVSDNTVNHVFTQRSSGRDMQRYNQVRIPLKDSNGRPLDATGFGRQLQKYLRDQLGLTAENKATGLGAGRLYIGEK